MNVDAQRLAALWEIVDLAIYELDELERQTESWIADGNPHPFGWECSKVRGVLLIARRLISTYQEQDEMERLMEANNE